MRTRLATTALLTLSLLGSVAATTTTTAVASSAASSAPAQASYDGRFAPLDRPGPRLSVPRERLRAALDCQGSPRSKGRPVLLSPGTSVTPEENFSWNYMKAFTAQGRYWCAVTMPHHTFGDVQVAGEHLVHAIRTMHARTGRRIAVVGHSQGGMNPRWALRFWPDTRAMVSDLIGMAPPTNGTTAINQCVESVTTCAPAVWQQRDEAAFIEALNSRARTFRGISYTVITTQRDETVTPVRSAYLPTRRGQVRNVAVQDLCPLDTYEHNLLGTLDPVAYALVMDALRHRGPADPSRIDPAVCGEQYMPFVDPAALDYLPALFGATNIPSVLTPFVNTAGAPMLAREPRLRCYVLASGC